MARELTQEERVIAHVKELEFYRSKRKEISYMGGFADGVEYAIDRTRKESEKRIKELEAQVLTMEVTEAEGDRVAKSMMDAAREQGRKEEREKWMKLHELE